MCINLRICSCMLLLFDVGLFKCIQPCCSEYLNKTDSGSLIVQGEMILSLSCVMRPRDIFDLEWLDNHP